MVSVERFLSQRLKLVLNRDKSRVAGSWMCGPWWNWGASHMNQTGRPREESPGQLLNKRDYTLNLRDLKLIFSLNSSTFPMRRMFAHVPL